MWRSFYDELLAWKKAGPRKPLLVQGARQVGKTYVIRQFCQAEFKTFIEINLQETPEVIEIYKQSLSAEEKLAKLQVFVRQDLSQSGAVLFVDEVQESEEFIAQLKFLNEKHPQITVICAGSLLGVKLKRFASSFPVGKVTIKQMHPLSFREFLIATDHDHLIDEIAAAFATDTGLLASWHEKCLALYATYLCVGGMPEAVMSYLERGLPGFDQNIHTSIRAAYLADMRKYVLSAAETLKLQAVYDSIPSQLSNSANKFQYSKVNSQARARNYGSSLDWLTSSGIVYRSVRVSKPEKPLTGFLDEDQFKLFVNDCGLLASALQIDFDDIIFDRLRQYKGVLAENYLATQLAAAGIPLRYWDSGNTAEVDFIIETSQGVIPLEVKAGGNVASRSLQVYVAKHRPAYCVRLSQKNFGFENGIKSVPLYATWCLGTLL